MRLLYQVCIVCRAKKTVYTWIKWKFFSLLRIDFLRGQCEPFFARCALLYYAIRSCVLFFFENVQFVHYLCIRVRTDGWVFPSRALFSLWNIDTADTVPTSSSSFIFGIGFEFFIQMGINSRSGYDKVVIVLFEIYLKCLNASLIINEQFWKAIVLKIWFKCNVVNEMQSVCNHFRKYQWIIKLILLIFFCEPT